MAKKQNEAVDLPAEFGGFSIRDIARIAVRVPKGSLTPAHADSLLAGVCVEAVLIEDPNAGDDTPGQKVMPGLQGFGSASRRISCVTVDARNPGGFRW